MTEAETAWLAGLIEERAIEARADSRWPNAKINVGAHQDVRRGRRARRRDIMGIDQARVTCKPDTRSGDSLTCSRCEPSADAVRVMRAGPPAHGRSAGRTNRRMPSGSTRLDERENA